MHPTELESRIYRLRARVRRLLALHGLSLLVALLVPMVIVAVLADWLIHLDAAVRLALLLGLIGLGGWLAYRHVLTPLVARFRDLDIALRIERRWPGLNDRLASTVQFFRIAADDDRHGSPALREATVRQTIEETRSIDFREIIDRRPALRVLGWASGSVVVGLLLVAASPQLSTIGLRRLFVPMGGDRWPQQTHLSLVAAETPRTVARGEPFALAVAVALGETAPSSAVATYRFDDGESVTEALRAQEGGLFRGRIELVTRPFTFSVAAGDDSSSIRDVAVKVVPPPALTDLTVRLISPPYTGLPEQTLASGRTQFRAVEGTGVVIEARANKPIATASLLLGEKASGAPVEFDPGRRVLKTRFTVEGSAPFWFDLLDTEGFRNREATRYDVRSLRDEAPPRRARRADGRPRRPGPGRRAHKVYRRRRLRHPVGAAPVPGRHRSSEPAREVALPLWDSQGHPPGLPSSIRRSATPGTWHP
jgi:hypothetical protein